MTTNAARYGALSTRRGHIAITWQASGDIEKSVELVWREQGGPAHGGAKGSDHWRRTQTIRRKATGDWSRRLSVHTRTALSERSSSPQSLA
jgi:two-component sensor histidine kinase